MNSEKMEIIVGREGNQIVKITDSTVGRRHCRITLSELGVFGVETIDGHEFSIITYANGKHIRHLLKTKADINDTLVIGNSQYQIADLLPRNMQVYSIDHLEKIYSDYKKFTDNQSRRKAIINAVKYVVMMVVITPVLITLRDGGLEGFMSLKTILYFVLLVLIFIVPEYIMPKISEKKYHDYQQNYVCPKCKNFLQNYNYDYLKQKGKCGCGAIWTWKGKEFE